MNPCASFKVGTSVACTGPICVVLRLYWLDVDHVGTIGRGGKSKHIFSISSIPSYSGLTVFRVRTGCTVCQSTDCDWVCRMYLFVCRQSVIGCV